MHTTCVPFFIPTLHHLSPMHPRIIVITACMPNSVGKWCIPSSSSSSIAFDFGYIEQLLWCAPRLSATVFRMPPHDLHSLTYGTVAISFTIIYDCPPSHSKDIQYTPLCSDRVNNACIAHHRDWTWTSAIEGNIHVHGSGWACRGHAQLRKYARTMRPHAMPLIIENKYEIYIEGRMMIMMVQWNMIH